MDEHQEKGLLERPIPNLGEGVHSMADLFDVMYVMTGSKSRKVSFYDLHRFVGSFYASDLETMKTNALKFAETYSHFFIKNSYWSVLNRETEKRPTLADWQAEFKLLGEMSELVEGGNPELLTQTPARQTLEELGYSRDWIFDQGYWNNSQPLIQRKLDYQCSPQIVDISRNGSGNYQTQLVPESLAGFCWLLVCRDAAEGIRYQVCPNCQEREVPSKSPRGQATKFCSQSCKLYASRKRTSA